MFVDELTIEAIAGNGGDGVVRWSHEKFKPKAGPAGGNGGRGGDVYVRAVKDPNRLAKYTGNPKFEAESGEPGRGDNQYGHNGADLYIDIPAGSRVTDIERERVFEVTEPGEVVKILTGGSGGFGNVHFKSDTNRAPEQSTAGNKGQSSKFLIEVSLVVDVGLVGLPNAGKSTTLNLITNAKSRIGAYPFTTLEPHLGDFHGYLIADIPGLIEGAAVGKGLGHTFLRHVSRTKMLLHVVSLESADPISDYYTIRTELNDYDKALTEKEEWVLLTKKDLVNEDFIAGIVKKLEKSVKRVFVLSQNDADSYQKFTTALSQHLSQTSV